ncbi:MAG: CDP-alcohol phosphatidyltransferase family protein [Candidatus Hodarchaeales archaeon]|jgi:phosphatidylglycerophosphate synthase
MINGYGPFVKLNRFLGDKIAFIALKYPFLTPNRITLISFSIHLLGIYLFTFGIYFLNIIASLLSFFALILDFVDGKVARERNMSSLFGAYLDNTVDRVVGVLRPIAIGLGLIANNGSIFFELPLILIKVNILTILIILISGNFLFMYSQMYTHFKFTHSHRNHKKDNREPIPMSMYPMYVMVMCTLLDFLGLYLVAMAIVANFLFILEFFQNVKKNYEYQINE